MSSGVYTIESSPPTPQDKACAVLVREALFPPQKDWNTQHHVAIHPALHALDRLRHDLVEQRETPFSSLFPRKVMLVPVPGSRGTQMQWNGQPDLSQNGSRVEVVPDVLTVQCQQCPLLADVVHAGVRAFRRESGKNSNNAGIELVICSNAVLGKDYDRFAARDNAATLLEQRRDLPVQSLKVVEETLAHELTKLQVSHDRGVDDSGPALLDQPGDCHEYAKLELLAAQAAECLYDTVGSEQRKGSRLRPGIGFSWLPQSTRRDFVKRCVHEVATQHTSRVFGREEGRKCVKDVVKETKK